MRDWLQYQYQNLFLYVPFLLAGGAALYFSMPYEPNLFMVHVLLTLICVGMFLRRIPVLLRAILLFLFGFCYAVVFTDFIDTPKLMSDMHNLEVIGSVKSIDYTDDKARIYLSVPANDINAGRGNAVVRVSVGDDFALPSVGDTVRANVGLFRPAAAYASETFDYARWAYFNGLTATGYVNDLSVVRGADSGGIDAVRDFMHNKSDSFLVDSLVLGYKNAVPENDSLVWMATGVGHVWSISGFHMTLVGGWLFLVFYYLFRCIPYIVRRIPAKIPALGCAWVGLLGYLFLSGLDVTTIRAFLMTTLLFVAFMFGRSVISMRNIALAFCFIFLINPHYVMQAGFQLSFAAVFGLVWLFSDIKPKMPSNKIMRVIYGCVLTSIVATIFTAPFVAMHFGVMPIYGLVGNLILLPVFSFAIMPLVLIGAVFGGSVAINLAHIVYDFTLQIATYISGLPLATVDMPHIPNAVIICFVVAFICLILLKNVRVKLNWALFCVFCICGVGIVYIAPRPIFYATYDNELVGFMRDDGKLEFNKSRAANHYFAFDTWKKINHEPIGTPNRRRKHDHGVYRYGDIVYIQKFVPLMQNLEKLCADDRVKYIVSYFDIKSEQCAHKILRGGFVIYPGGRVRYAQRNRQWH